MKYRILEKDGYFYPQYQSWKTLFIWTYMKHGIDNSQPVYGDSLEYAVKYLDNVYEQEMISKIIKSEPKVTIYEYPEYHAQPKYEGMKLSVDKEEALEDAINKVNKAGKKRNNLPSPQDLLEEAEVMFDGFESLKKANESIKQENSDIFKNLVELEEENKTLKDRLAEYRVLEVDVAEMCRKSILLREAIELLKFVDSIECPSEVNKKVSEFLKKATNEDNK